MAHIKIAVIGLGKMGFGIASRLARGGYAVIGFDPDAAARDHARKAGITVISQLSELTNDCATVWLMVPAGKVVDAVLQELVKIVAPKTVIIDGGNSFFKDSMRRAKDLALHDIAFLDCGVSGGVHGLTNGFCLMVGGELNVYQAMLPTLQLIAAQHGVAHVGPSGAGHYVKMVHNGIEYGILQAYGEGFQLLKEGDFSSELDLHQIAAVWQEGSVIRSFILGLTKNIFTADQALISVNGSIGENGTGRWTFENAQQHNIPMPVLAAALQVRKESRDTNGTYATKVVALLREQFGGHPVTRIDTKK
jgi:6-phosphogluconate dehydrogenase